MNNNNVLEHENIPQVAMDAINNVHKAELTIVNNLHSATLAIDEVKKSQLCKK